MEKQKRILCKFTFSCDIRLWSHKPVNFCIVDLVISLKEESYIAQNKVNPKPLHP